MKVFLCKRLLSAGLRSTSKGFFIMIMFISRSILANFAVIAASSLQGSLSTRLRSVFLGIFDQSSKSILVNSHIDVGGEGRPGSPSLL